MVMTCKSQVKAKRTPLQVQEHSKRGFNERSKEVWNKKNCISSDIQNFWSNCYRTVLLKWIRFMK